MLKNTSVYQSVRKRMHVYLMLTPCSRWSTLMHARAWVWYDESEKVKISRKKERKRGGRVCQNDEMLSSNWAWTGCKGKLPAPRLFVLAQREGRRLVLNMSKLFFLGRIIYLASIQIKTEEHAIYIFTCDKAVRSSYHTWWSQDLTAEGERKRNVCEDYDKKVQIIKNTHIVQGRGEHL